MVCEIIPENLVIIEVENDGGKLLEEVCFFIEREVDYDEEVENLFVELDFEWVGGLEE